MLTNYIITAFRNLWKHKEYTAINVVGLSVGFFVCVFLFLIVHFQLSFDSFHADSDRIFQTYLFANHPEKATRSGSVPVPLAPVLRADHQEVDAAARVKQMRSMVEYKGRYFEKVVVMTDADFLNVFSFPLVTGAKAAVLNNLSSIVISENMARAVFGSEDPVGKPLQLGPQDNRKQYVVSGVFADCPENSSLRFDALTRIENVDDYHKTKDRWDIYTGISVYVKLAAGTDPAAFAGRLKPFTQKYFPGEVEDLKKKGAKADPQGDIFALRLQKLSRVHFDPDLSNGPSFTMIYALLSIAFFILLIACINFINLSIARSFTRAKEVGIRKCLGALKGQLFVQVWGEACIICIMGFLLGTFLVYVLMPEFNAMLGTEFELSYLFRLDVMVLLLTTLGVITLVAGGYPAWQMAKFKPVEVLKGKFTLKRPGSIRNALIITQFAMATLLSCCTIIAVQQVEHLRQQPLGFQQEQVISIPVQAPVNGRQVLQRLRNELAGDPTVVAVTGTDVNLGRGKDGISTRSVIGFTYRDREVASNWLLVDYDYLETLNIKLLAGRDFSPAHPSDSMARVVITESMAKMLGENDPIGKSFQTAAGGPLYEIIGMVPDFHLYDLTTERKPITMHISYAKPVNYILVRVSSQNLSNAMNKIQHVWQKVVPQAEFMGSFLTENLDAWYRGEERLLKIFTIASALAILLSSLGLFAVAVLMMQQRIKEVGIRKVLGASIPSIIVVLSKDFVQLVLAALVVAIPLAWYLMRTWLSSYPYRVELSAWVFLGVGMGAVLIALATVSFQTIKAALTNPVKSLKSE